MIILLINSIINSKDLVVYNVLLINTMHKHLVDWLLIIVFVYNIEILINLKEKNSLLLLNRMELMNLLIIVKTSIMLIIILVMNVIIN